MQTAGLKLLILEDRSDDAELMIRELRQARLQFEDRRATNEQDFIAQLAWHPDVILSDFGLPRFDALQALALLRERNLDIPLIVVTGSISEEVAVDCIKQGAVDYLLKDRMTRLPAAVTSALAEKSLRDSKRLAEERLRDSEERLRLALEAAHMGTWDWNRVTGRIGHSRELGPLVGLPAGEFFPTIEAFLEVLHPDDRAMVIEQISRSTQPNINYGIDYRVIWPDGSVHWIAAKGRVHFDEQHQPTRMIGVLMDMTERVRLEQEATQRLAELAHVSRLSTMGELVSELAHELNQPLYAIANFSEACLNVSRVHTNAQHSDMQEWLQQISMQSQRAGEIIRRVYSFVRKGPTLYSNAAINELVEHCVRLMQVSLRLADTKLRLDLAKNLPPVLVDEVQIQQVLVNLLNNAIDAMRTLPVADRLVTITTQPSATDKIAVQVRDQGPGIADNQLNNLFEPFFTTKTEGMGMGLAISRSIVEAHGGQLWAEPNSDRGLAFHFSLPISQKEKTHGD